MTGKLLVARIQILKLVDDQMVDLRQVLVLQSA